MFFFATSVRVTLRDPIAFLPGLCSLAVTYFACAMTPDPEPAFRSWVASAALLLGWIFGHGFLSESSPVHFTRTASLALTRRPGTAVSESLIGVLLASIFLSTYWIPLSLLPLSSDIGLLDAFLVLVECAGIAAGSTLAVALAGSLLPRVAATAASGAWVAFAFPVSPLLLSVDEKAHLGGALHRFGSIAWFDLGLFLLVLAIALRRALRGR